MRVRGKLISAGKIIQLGDTSKRNFSINGDTVEIELKKGMKVIGKCKSCDFREYARSVKSTMEHYCNQEKISQLLWINKVIFPEFGCLYWKPRRKG